jgi:DNA polymerase III alpha subunit (gram-positive type)
LVAQSQIKGSDPASGKGITTNASETAEAYAKGYFAIGSVSEEVGLSFVVTIPNGREGGASPTLHHPGGLTKAGKP